MTNHSVVESLFVVGSSVAVLCGVLDQPEDTNDWIPLIGGIAVLVSWVSVVVFLLELIWS